MDNTNQSIGSLPPEKKSHGALIAVLVILFLIIIGGLYFLGQRISDDSYKILENNGNDESTEAINNQSDSDEVSSIEADLEASYVDNLDQGAAAIEAELQ